jgi:ATP-binding protein involved in chromosome partitioning
MPEAGPAGAETRQTPLEGVGCVIAVSSCKGGVGKSTVATNLAVALARSGKRVGLADVDIYGPSVPIMLGISEQPRGAGDSLIPPVRAHGIDVISMGFFLDDNAPVIWRGPMAMSATKQFLRGVKWGELDYLIVDLPPGTGDIVLTLCQEIGVAMFRKVNAPVLGVVQNMSAYVCEKCGTHDELFGGRRGDQLATELEIPLLGELPIETAIRVAGDEGTPVVERDPEHAVSKAFVRLAGEVESAVERSREATSAPEPVEIAGDKEHGTVRIRWSDGVSTEYDMVGLRGWCPCAGCQGHEGKRNFIPVTEAQLVGVEGVGRYAVRLIWADGHETGMYPYDYLRELAEVPECKPA